MRTNSADTVEQSEAVKILQRSGLTDLAGVTISEDLELSVEADVLSKDPIERFKWGLHHGNFDAEFNKRKALSRYDLSGCYDKFYAEGYRAGQKVHTKLQRAKDPEAFKRRWTIKKLLEGRFDPMAVFSPR